VVCLLPTVLRGATPIATRTLRRHRKHRRRRHKKKHKKKK